MEYVIRIKNKEPYEHPIAVDNFTQAFPEEDLNALSDKFAEFRKNPPAPGKYEVPVGSHYAWVNGVVEEVWTYRPMTEEEIQHKDRLEAHFATNVTGSAPRVAG